MNENFTDCSVLAHAFTLNKCCDNQNRFSTVKTTQHVHSPTVQVADLVFNVHVLHIFEKYRVFTSFKELF